MLNPFMRRIGACATVLVAMACISSADAREPRAFIKAPKTVKSAIASDFPSAKISECTRKNKKGVITYKILLTDAHGAKHTIVMDSSGKILKDKILKDVKAKAKP